jgi:CheY-like chemotaxis protein
VADAEPGKLALLIDDNLMSAVRVKAGLQRQGYRVDTAKAAPETGAAAPDLILINLGSRGIDGVAIGAACMERFPNSQLRGFCGHLEVERRQAAKAAGFERLLTNEEALT